MPFGEYPGERASGLSTRGATKARRSPAQQRLTIPKTLAAGQSMVCSFVRFDHMGVPSDQDGRDPPHAGQPRNPIWS